MKTTGMRNRIDELDFEPILVQPKKINRLVFKPRGKKNTEGDLTCQGYRREPHPCSVLRNGKYCMACYNHKYAVEHPREYMTPEEAAIKRKMRRERKMNNTPQEPIKKVIRATRLTLDLVNGVILCKEV